MKLYLLYYDTDGSGAREEWSVFYTPCEIFDTPAKRQTRIDFIKKQLDEDGNPMEYIYHTVDQDLMTIEDIIKWDQ